MNTASTTNTLLTLDELILDPQLQCREETDPAVVNEYAALLRDGVHLPPIRAVQVPGEGSEPAKNYVVDGWHRVLACKQLGIDAMVVALQPGTRRDAIAGAAKANTDHGLRRTHVGKRRAVRLLLMDQEWCRLSGRELAELSGTSHTFVNEVRQRYSVNVGEPLPQRRIELVDGEASPAWVQLKSELPSHQHHQLELYRTAAGPRALLSVVQRDYLYNGEKWRRVAAQMRAEELACEAWPEAWGTDDQGNVMTRCVGLDSIEDLELALRSTAACAAQLLMGDNEWRLKLRDRLYDVLGYALLLEAKRIEPKMATVFAGRPRLLFAYQLELAAVEKAKQEAAAAGPTSGQREVAAQQAFEELARKVQAGTLPSDELRAAPEGTISKLVNRGVFRDCDAEYIDVLRELGPKLHVLGDCKTTWCDGVVHGTETWNFCVRCGLRPSEGEQIQKRVAQGAGTALTMGRLRLTVNIAGRQVVVGHELVKVASALNQTYEQQQARMVAWLQACPSAGLAQTLKDQLVALAGES